MPKVSVIIPNFNHARYLRRRVDSILAQTFRDFEIILLDDCSTDESRAVIELYRQIENVRIIYNEQNSGSPFKQWRKGVNLAQGELVWIAESDDYAHTDFLKIMVPALEACPQAGLAYCRSFLVDEQEIALRDSLAYTQSIDPLRWQHDYVGDGRIECGRFLIRKNTIPNASAVVARRHALADALNAEISFVVCGDWMIWARILLKSRVVYRTAVLNFFRHHRGSVSVRTNAERRMEEAMRVRLHLSRRVAVPKDVRRIIQAEATRRAIQALLGRRGLRSISSRSRICWLAIQIHTGLWAEIVLQLVRRFSGTGPAETASDPPVPQIPHPASNGSLSSPSERQEKQAVP